LEVPDVEGETVPVVNNLCEKQDWAKLQEWDQLAREIKSGKVLSEFKEGQSFTILETWQHM